MTAPSTGTVSRPGTITLIVVLMWINAIIEIIGGVLLMLGATSSSFVTGFDEGAGVEDVTGGVLLTAGIIGVIFGIITILLAIGLKNGSNGVRIFVTILIVLQILVDVAELTIWQIRSILT